MIKAAIFDMDGTLLDSMGAWHTVGGELLRSKGISPPPGLEGAMQEMTFEQALDYMREKTGLRMTNLEFIQQVDALMLHKYRYEIPLKHGVRDFLQALRENHVRCCVATASSQRMAQAALERNNIRRYFDFILTCDDVGCGKEYPAIYEQALERLNTAKEDSLVFEDVLQATRTAKEAGFRVAVVEDLYARKHKQELQELADIYISNFANCEVTSL